VVRASPSVRDAVFIGVAVFLSLVWYAPHLGFYSDDWAFLGMYATAADQTVRGFHDASYSAQHAMRPVQLWLCAILYGIFGMNPAGYHWVNAVLIVLNPLLVYAIAHQLRLSRMIAAAVALTYGVLPNYSTDRYWYVAFAITLSMSACLLSVYADLKAIATRTPAVVLWKLVAAAALMISVLAYEVSLPFLLAASPVLIVWRLFQSGTSVTRARMIRAAALIAINVVLLGGLAAYKVRTTVRLGAEQGMAAQVGAIVRQAIRTDLPRGEYGLNVRNAVAVHFVEYGIQLIPNALRLARNARSEVRVLTLLVTLATLAYFLFAFRDERWPSTPGWAVLAVSGAGVFALGYAIFLTNYNVQFTTTGIANRSAIAATLGAAMCLIGISGLIAASVTARWARTAIFAAAVAGISGSGVLIVNVVAEDWMRAYAAERNVLSNIRERFSSLPPKSTLLLDGVCPYIGPAIVFEADWDLTGALQVYYGNRTVSANVVTPRMTADDAAIVATIYGQPARYPYSSSLFAYHAGTGVVQPLADAATARAWLSRSLASSSCPAGREGIGVEPF
jgi:hypothetical protein